MRDRFERLFEDHARDVLAYALRRTDRATAEDVVAEVFAVAWRRREQVPADQPVLWLYAVARRVLANERRATRRRTALTDALSSVSATAIDDSWARDLREALAALKTADREVLMLTAWEGLDGTQAAVVLECSPAAVHTRLHRARARLAAELERRGTPIRQTTADDR